MTTDRQPFGLDWVRQYLPHYLTAEPSQLHTDLADDLRDFHLARGQRKTVIAPRGAAKTTWLTKAYPLWCVVEGVEPFILILAETGDQAEGYLSAIKDELEANDALARDYPHATGEGSVWQSSRVKTRNGVMVLARGAGGRILGRTHRSSRPTLVVGDDMNERRDAYSPTLRRRKLDWFLRDALNVGEPRTNYLAAGTPIHREAIVCALRDNPVWSARSYRSVLSWPDRMDLWAEWERRLMNLASPTRLVTARAFYEANREVMDAGAVVLWPAREPLYDLMVKRAEIGPQAFGSEKQDTPGTDGAQEWPAEYFDWDGFFVERWPSGLVDRFQSLDPSKGLASKPGDWQAHVMLGLGSDGNLYFDAEFHREPITDCVARAIEIFRRWNPRELRAEGNNTMGLLTPEFTRQCLDLAHAGRPVGLTRDRCVEVYHSQPKLARIRFVSGYLSRRQVRVLNTPGGRMLVDQWRDVPTGEFDDGPDAAGTVVHRAQELHGGKR